MTPPDFTAAEERVLARRQRKIKSELRSSPLSASSQLNRLPPPLKSIGQQGISAWDVIKGRDGTRPSFRVGQIDAELLDEELLELLKGQVGDGLKLFGVGYQLPLERVSC